MKGQPWHFFETYLQEQNYSFITLSCVSLWMSDWKVICVSRRCTDKEWVQWEPCGHSKESTKGEDFLHIFVRNHSLFSCQGKACACFRVWFCFIYLSERKVLIFVPNHCLSICEVITMIMIAFKGVIRDFLQSPHCAASCLQHVRSSGTGAVVCKSHATHRALIMCNMLCYVPCGMKGQLSY